MSNGTETASRFDMPKAMRDFMDEATEILDLDAASIFELAMNHGTDWRAWVDVVVAWAYADRHMPGTTHADTVRAADKVRSALAL